MENVPELTQEKKPELLKTLKSFLPLCEKEKEFGGWINLHTGEIEGPFEGKEHEFDFVSKVNGIAEYVAWEFKDLRAKAETGWAIFHTHPRSTHLELNEPSLDDVYTAHTIGTVHYVITVNGVYMIEPKEVREARSVKNIWNEASSISEKLKSLGGEAAYWNYWGRVLTEFLPTEIRLIKDSSPLPRNIPLPKHKFPW